MTSAKLSEVWTETTGYILGWKERQGMSGIQRQRSSDEKGRKDGHARHQSVYPSEQAAAGGGRHHKGITREPPSSIS